MSEQKKEKKETAPRQSAGQKNVAPRDIRFGGEWGEDQHGLVLWGDDSHPVNEWEVDAVCAQHPSQACLAGMQAVSMWYRLQKPQAYGRVKSLLDSLAEKVKELGYEMAEPDELGWPGDAVSAMSNLSEDYTLPKEGSVHGYNAAGGFTLVAVKPGTEPGFTDSEAEALAELASAHAEQVYGRRLERRKED